MKISVLKSNDGCYLCNRKNGTMFNRYCLAYDYDLLTGYSDLIFNFTDEEEEQYDLDRIANEWNRRADVLDHKEMLVRKVDVDFLLKE